ncbi:hypothetical protein [Longibacter salinarum]|uniref:hypothetical protein n=1 Tax=Longibacter salinarum TaxID=1850348 RepID=UPI0015CEF58B|nr:hypothetical protein [Longibacter salinarum]
MISIYISGSDVRTRQSVCRDGANASSTFNSVPAVVTEGAAGRMDNDAGTEGEGVA